jgi:hypothetical protein
VPLCLLSRVYLRRIFFAFIIHPSVAASFHLSRASFLSRLQAARLTCQTTDDFFQFFKFSPKNIDDVASCFQSPISQIHCIGILAKFPSRRRLHRRSLFSFRLETRAIRAGHAAAEHLVVVLTSSRNFVGARITTTEEIDALLSSVRLDITTTVVSTVGLWMQRAPSVAVVLVFKAIKDYRNYLWYTTCVFP